ncbi:hypothetical protein MMC25_003546 [Agyrium rufum]|nr:hypothetical protein [Agyrium rufum]
MLLATSLSAQGWSLSHKSSISPPAITVDLNPFDVTTQTHLSPLRRTSTASSSSTSSSLRSSRNSSIRADSIFLPSPDSAMRPITLARSHSNCAYPNWPQRPSLSSANFSVTSPMSATFSLYPDVSATSRLSNDDLENWVSPEELDRDLRRREAQARAQVTISHRAQQSKPQQAGVRWGDLEEACDGAEGISWSQVSKLQECHVVERPQRRFMYGPGAAGGGVAMGGEPMKRGGSNGSGSSRRRRRSGLGIVIE